MWGHRRSFRSVKDRGFPGGWREEWSVFGSVEKRLKALTTRQKEQNCSYESEEVHRKGHIWEQWWTCKKTGPTCFMDSVAEFASASSGTTNLGCFPIQSSSALSDSEEGGTVIGKFKGFPKCWLITFLFNPNHILLSPTIGGAISQCSTALACSNLSLQNLSCSSCNPLYCCLRDSWEQIALSPILWLVVGGMWGKRRDFQIVSQRFKHWDSIIMWAISVTVGSPVGTLKK